MCLESSLYLVSVAVSWIIPKFQVFHNVFRNSLLKAPGIFTWIAYNKQFLSC